MICCKSINQKWLQSAFRLLSRPSWICKPALSSWSVRPFPSWRKAGKWKAWRYEQGLHESMRLFQSLSNSSLHNFFFSSFFFDFFVSSVDSSISKSNSEETRLIPLEELLAETAWQLWTGQKEVLNGFRESSSFGIKMLPDSTVLVCLLF